MTTLVLPNIPDDLYQRLKETAVAHHYSVAQEVIITLTEALVSNKPQEQAAPKPNWEAYAQEMKAFWDSLPADSHTPGEIIGYDENGLPG